MVRKSLWIGLSMLMCIAVAGLPGCSDDSSTSPNDTSNNDYQSVSFTEYGEIVEDIAPPVYSTPAGAPGVFDDWTSGDYPLLGKVFGDNEPMSLYWNMDELDGAVELLNEFLLVNDSDDYSADSGFVEISTLSGLTTIPTQAQPVFGFSAVQVDNLVTIQPPMVSDMEYAIGFTLTDSTQLLLTYFTAPTEGDGNGTETFLFYAYVNLNDSTVEIRGVFYKDYGDQTSARWVYDIETVNETDFSYRMSWYADDFGGTSGLGCIIGGGNKDSEFALKFRQYTPADTSVVDSSWVLDQMFGPNYADLGTTISAGFEDYVNEDNIFTYEYMPTALLTNPWAE